MFDKKRAYYFNNQLVAEIGNSADQCWSIIDIGLVESSKSLAINDQVQSSELARPKTGIGDQPDSIETEKRLTHPRHELPIVKAYKRRNNVTQGLESLPKDIPSSSNDLLIALRKGVRECTKYPLCNFLAYDQLKKNFRVFTCSVDSQEIPTSIEEALNNPSWCAAVNEEMQALVKNKTWDVVTRTPGVETVGCRWVFSIKYNTNGAINRFKARLVAKGYTQTYGVDYMETFAPVAKLNTIRIIFSLSVKLD